MRPGAWLIDSDRSSVEVTVRHLGVTTVKGTFEGLEGRLEIAEDGALRAEASLPADSISTDDEKRDSFLRSPEFLNAASHPRATFSASGASAAGVIWQIEGVLAIAGVTAPVMLTVRQSAQPEATVLIVEAQIQRDAFGLRFPQVVGAGDAVVAKKVRLQATVAVVPV